MVGHVITLLSFLKDLPVIMLARPGSVIDPFPALGNPKTSTRMQVSVLVWPDCVIEFFPRGTTAGDVVMAKGLVDGSGGRLFPPSDLFSPGDLLVRVLKARAQMRCLSKDASAPCMACRP